MTAYKVKRKVFNTGDLLCWKTRTGYVPVEYADRILGRSKKYVYITTNGQTFRVFWKSVLTPEQYLKLKKKEK